MQYCPHPELQRSRRRWYEVPRSWLLRMQPYRCRLCHQRLWRYSGVWYRDLVVFIPDLVAGWWWFGNADKVDPLVLVQTLDVAVEPQHSAPDKKRIVIAATSTPSAAPLRVEEDMPAARSTSAPSLAVRVTPAVVATASPRRVVVRPKAPSNVAKVSPRPQQASASNVLLDAQVLSDENRFQLQLKYAGNVASPRLFRLQAPPRLVLDIPGDWSIRGDQLQALKGDGQFVQQIRFGKHAKSMRVVLDLNVDVNAVKPLVVKKNDAIQLRISR